MRKKRISICMALLILVCSVLSACSSKDTEQEQIQVQEKDTKKEIEISLWTFPVGNWGNQTAVSSLITGFQREHPEIQVKMECLNYDNGDEKIKEAVLNGNLPDLVFEGPERLVAGWGDQGLLADLSDLWQLDTAKGIYENIRKACRHSNGAYYAFPVCMTAHCMAINYDLFKEAGALKYIDEETHTWTTENFKKAVKTLTAYRKKRAGVIYCKNQSGDQGTRALVNNLYGGAFTDDAHSTYTLDSEENKKALQLLYDMEGIDFEPSMASADEIAQFCSKELAMSFCWNASIEITQTINNPDLDFEVFPMAFPVDGGEPRLQGGIWGFGVFDNGDEERLQAAKTFIQYMTENDDSYTRAVLTSSFWPVRDMRDVYENDVLMEEYGMFMRYMDDYYQITPGWTTAREGWWKMLQEIGNGMDVTKAVNEFTRQVNGERAAS